MNVRWLVKIKLQTHKSTSKLRVNATIKQLLDNCTDKNRVTFHGHRIGFITVLKNGVIKIAQQILNIFSIVTQSQNQIGPLSSAICVHIFQTKLQIGTVLQCHRLPCVLSQQGDRQRAAHTQPTPEVHRVNKVCIKVNGNDEQIVQTLAWTFAVSLFVERKLILPHVLGVGQHINKRRVWRSKTCQDGERLEMIGINDRMLLFGLLISNFSRSHLLRIFSSYLLNIYQYWTVMFYLQHLFQYNRELVTHWFAIDFFLYLDCGRRHIYYNKQVFQYEQAGVASNEFFRLASPRLG